VSLRTERIAEQVRAELAKLLREEVTDPRIGMLSLTRVDVAPDLSNALVYWSPLDLKRFTGAEEIEGEGVEAVSAGLASAAGFLRSRLAKSLPLRRTPKLDFRYDPSIEAGTEIMEVLADVAEEDARRTELRDDAGDAD